MTASRFRTKEKTRSGVTPALITCLLAGFNSRSKVFFFAKNGPRFYAGTERPELKSGAILAELNMREYQASSEEEKELLINEICFTLRSE